MPIRPQCAKVAVSFKKESAYGTVLIDADIQKRYDPTEPVILGLTLNKIDDRDSIKGHEFPVDPALDIIVAQDIQIPFSFPCDLSLLGLMMALAFGQDTESGTNPNYTHTYKALDPCTQDSLLSTSWALGLQGDTASFYKAKGVMINELRLVLDSPGRLTLTGTAFSDGTLTAVPAYTFPTTLSAADPILGSMGGFKTANSGSALADKTPKLRGFEFVMNNNLDVADGRSNVVTSGRYLSSLRYGNRSYQLVVRVEGHQGDEFWDDYIGNVMKDVEILVTKNANRLVSIRFKNCKINNCTFAFDGLRDTLELTYEPFYTTADASPIIVEVKNGDTGYLAAPA